MKSSYIFPKQNNLVMMMLRTSKPIEDFYKKFTWAKQRLHLETRSKQTEKMLPRMTVFSFFYVFVIKEGI